jgi:flagellin
MTSQINGLNVAVRNANDGISIAQTAEGAMQESTNILQRMRDLSVQSANGSNSDSDRASLQKEVSALQTELTRIAETTTFGGQSLLDGSYGKQAFQIGSESGQEISLTMADMSANKLGETSTTLGGSARGALTAATVATNTSNGVVNADLTVGGAKGQVAVNIGAGDSAKEIAALVNAESSNTGVTAEASTNVRLSNLSKDGGTGGTATELKIQSGDGNAAQTFTVTDENLETLANSINQNGQLGDLSASIDDAGKLVIESRSGQNVSLTLDDDGGGTAANDASMTVEALDSSGTVINSTGLDANSSAAINTIVTGDVKLSSGSTDSLTATGDATVTTGSEAKQKLSIQQLDISTADGAKSALNAIDAALQTVDDQRSDLGAIQNRFESTISNLTNISENVSAARSRIRDVDFAQETAKLSQNQILQQAGTTILAQANQLPQAALSLLG